MSFISAVLETCLNLTGAIFSSVMTVSGVLLTGLYNLIILLLSQVLSVPWLSLVERLVKLILRDCAVAFGDLATAAGYPNLAVVITFGLFVVGLVILAVISVALVRWLLGAIWVIISAIASIVWAVLTGILHPFRITFGFIYRLIFGP